ncbi:hypothetical protein Sango_0222400 [Sesamum angolense]|uniref:Polymerase nucleotidyl transferase domain-containing protein n=1 Tax=Sesamum angolense TaxID=2727404 RepID=A0AAE1XHG4_9LAMI|nr:hypothetical protein Sango_0222400 [Sesamum angolense]
MGENEGWVEPGPPLPNGLLPGAGPVMRALDTDRWVKAEERTAELISCIQPNQLSEERRNAVADYVQRLIMKCFPCQVCTFGSVPLKTYLPDGDIDLTAFSHNQSLKDTWAHQVRDMLENEEKNENAEFHVKEVQYIQAEVKIIKCLVENIVVDISFNQVGGLCTLCFLDEVDNLINQNHLFKRSIILIKAWCYYESRILGAHHGLISTYALETLVLYIFHVFNNSFHGPLEVLYRFLEFFSSFDWDNFCVSLWGPVRISSLPDVTAEPPRKDSGELLLSKLFLDACSSVYAVFPGGQENNGQPFVSKHFNVIDPLRVNNNLGRSVSKGNFFRIRSAFAFGAKRLARLLECPKDNLIFEVNQFFMNTWERHGSGNRPDAPRLGSWRLRLSTPDSPHEFGNSDNCTSGRKVKENSSAYGMEGDAHSLKSQFNVNSLRVTDQIGGHTFSDQVVLNDKVQRDLKEDHPVNDTQGRLLFARTRSSPELTDTYSDFSSQVRSNRRAETADAHATYSKLDSSNRRKHNGPESLVSHSNPPSSGDTSSVRHVPSQRSPDAADTTSISNSNHRDLGLDVLSEEFSASSAAQLMQQEEQDIVNMMASASLQGFNGQVHVPFNLTSGHLPYSMLPSFLASMGYTQRNMPGFFPTNIPLMDPSFSHVQFPQGLVSPQSTHYFPGIGLNPSEDSVERSNENFGPSDMNTRETDHDFWQEQDVSSSSGYDPENGNFDRLQSDQKPPISSSGLKYVPPQSRVSGSSSTTRVQKKHLREKRGAVRENIDCFPIQDIRSSEVCAEERSTSSRKREKKMVSAEIAASHGKGKILSEHVSDDTDDDDLDWSSLLHLGTEIVERHPGCDLVAPLQVPRHHMPSFEVAQTSGSDPMIPLAPMLLGPGARQRTNDNSGLVAFYPTGPPIPFLTMLPCIIFHLRLVLRMHQVAILQVMRPWITVSGMSFSPKEFDQSEDLSPVNSLGGATSIMTSEEQKSDILNSDFASHWQNLQFGRFCQNPRYQGPLLHPSPVMVPPVYLQGRFPYENPSRPLSTNTNLFSQLMTSYGHRLVPVAPIPSVSSRHPNIYTRYMDDVPRYRSGTGTYLPNPVMLGVEVDYLEIILEGFCKERHSSGSRRGNYNHDRNDSFSDREGNWNANSKSRAAARSHNRSQTDKSNSRMDRFTHSESRSDRSWNSYRHDSLPSFRSQNGQLHSNSSQNGPQSVAYSMYPLAATNHNGVSNGPSVPPVMMLYPFDHNATYGSRNEQLEFGSLGPVGFSGINDQSQLNDGIRARAFEEHRLHGSSGHRSSPDQPSSPHHQR